MELKCVYLNGVQRNDVTKAQVVVAQKVRKVVKENQSDPK